MRTLPAKVAFLLALAPLATAATTSVNAAAQSFPPAPPPGAAPPVAPLPPVVRAPEALPTWQASPAAGGPSDHYRVDVAIDATRPNVVIERRVSVDEKHGGVLIIPFRSTETVWEQVCVTPCRLLLDMNSTYRVASQNGTTGSRPFVLSGGADALHLRVDAGDLRAHNAGRIMTGAGALAVVVGGSLLAASHHFDGPMRGRVAGFVTGGAGIAALAIGITLAHATRSEVTDDAGPDIARLSVPITKGVALTQEGLVF